MLSYENVQLYLIPRLVNDILYAITTSITTMVGSMELGEKPKDDEKEESGKINKQLPKKFVYLQQ